MIVRGEMEHFLIVWRMIEFVYFPGVFQKISNVRMLKLHFEALYRVFCLSKTHVNIKMNGFLTIGDGLFLVAVFFLCSLE